MPAVSAEVFEDYRQLGAKNLRTAVCIGNFDGLHCGHQEVIKACLHEAKRHGLASTAFSFHPHPSKVLKKTQPPKLIFILDEKTEFLTRAGLNFILEQNFSNEFAQMAASEFIDTVLRKNLRAEKVIVGTNFKFGFKAQGNVELLRKSYGEENVHVVSPVLNHGRAVSSTWIRELIAQGEMLRAQELLGYPYFLTGEVVHGEKRGTQLGVPTANIATEKEALPANGIYMVMVEDLTSHQFYCGAASIGHNPTFGDTQKISIEAHLLNFADQLYSRRLRVFFIKKIRNEMKFSAVEELKKKIEEDLQISRYFFQGMNWMHSSSQRELWNLKSPDATAQNFQPYKRIEEISKSTA